MILLNYFLNININDNDVFKKILYQQSIARAVEADRKKKLLKRLKYSKRKWLK